MNFKLRVFYDHTVPSQCPALLSFPSVCGGNRLSKCRSQTFQVSPYFLLRSDPDQQSSSITEQPQSKDSHFLRREGGLPARPELHLLLFYCCTQQRTLYSGHRAELQSLSLSGASCSWLFAFATALSYLTHEPWTMIVSSGFL